MSAPAKTRPCFWFESQGLAAAHFYVSLLPDSYIETVSHPDPDKPPLVIEFILAGTPYMILNAGPMYPLTPAASISVLTEDQAETDALWAGLLQGGGAEGRCGWVIDRYGLSWQVIPKILPQLLMAEDTVAAQRAHAAMMQMQKIDIAALEAAHRGEG